MRGFGDEFHNAMPEGTSNVVEFSMCLGRLYKKHNWFCKGSEIKGYSCPVILF